MSGSLSGGSQSQSGQQAGSTSGSSQSSMTPTTTQGWGSIDQLLRGNLGQTGLNPDQQMATDSWKNYLTKDNNNGLWGQINGNQQLGQFTTPQANTSAGAPAVNSTNASQYMGAYQNPYQDQVVNSTMADLSHINDKNQNDLRAQYGGQGWSPTAGAPAGEQVAAGTAADNYTRTAASTLGNLRSQGFNTALQGGQFDAGNQLDASKTTASNTMANNQFNANQADQAQSRAMSAIQQMIGNNSNIMTQGGQALTQLYDMAGGGNSNLGNYMQLQPMGQNQSGSTSGNYSGTSSGNGSSKGGGIGAKLF